MDLIRRFENRIFKMTHPEIGEVWQFHSVCPQNESGHSDNWAVSPRRLQDLIIEYKQRNCSFVSVEELSERIRWSFSAFGKQFVAITLDDGFADNYEYALPVFEEYGVPFCIYVSPGGIIAGNNNVYLNRRQLKELSENRLCTIGAHTMSHSRLPKLSFEKQQEEIINSKLWLEDVISKPVEHFAYPFGEYNADTLKIMCDFEFHTAVMGWGGSVRMGCDRHRIPRYVIWENVKYKHL